MAADKPTKKNLETARVESLDRRQLEAAKILKEAVESIRLAFQVTHNGTSR